LILDSPAFIIKYNLKNYFLDKYIACIIFIYKLSTSILTTLHGIIEKKSTPGFSKITARNILLALLNL